MQVISTHEAESNLTRLEEARAQMKRWEKYASEALTRKAKLTLRI
jgi:hypothetical protein